MSASAMTKETVLAAGGWKHVGKGKSRLALNGGFYLHVAKVRVGALRRGYSAQLKHAGGLNVTCSELFNKASDAIPWARWQADAFCHRVGVEGGLF